VHVVAVTSLAFSADGKFLASVGSDAEHTVAVHEWETKPSATLGGAFSGHLVAKEPFGRANPYVMAFNPVDGRLVVGGGAVQVEFSLPVA
jgi:microtubule-associated protein-like 6